MDQRPQLPVSPSSEEPINGSRALESQSTPITSDKTIARWCHLPSVSSNSGVAADTRVSWDATKIQCFLSNQELADQLLLRNLARGAILNGRFWPVLLDDSRDPLIKYRTLSYLHSLKAMPVLKDDELAYFCIAVRDLWLANSRGLITDPSEKMMLDKLLNMLDEEVLPGAELRGLAFSFCPTKNRRVLKWAERLDELMSEAGSGMLDCIAQLALPGSEGQAPLSAVWVDARDLSYHNFECILPLDRALRTPLLPDGNQAPLRLTLEKAKPLHSSMYAFETRLGGRDSGLLLELDQLGLYQRPANYATRGGERCIFSSTLLSNALTTAVRECGLLELLDAPGVSGNEFVRCNNVFRCNRFAPGDYKFERHMDTPYYDEARNHVSKYTVIIYLTGGEADPALRIDGNDTTESLSLPRLAPMQVVVFDQRYEHEGKAFVSGNKVFLRSELIFRAGRSQHEPSVAALFSSAVYLSLESTFQPELALYAHQAYEQVNRAHWGLSKSDESKAVQHGTPAGAVQTIATVAPTLMKRWRESAVVFATNGHEYWFACDAVDKAKQASQLKFCALIAVLDYFNATYEDREPTKRVVDQAAYESKWLLREAVDKAEKQHRNAKMRHANWTKFKKECKTSALGSATSGDVLASVWVAIAQVNSSEEPVRLISKEEKQTWLDDTESAARKKHVGDHNRSSCCPDHDPERFLPWTSDRVHEVFDLTVAWSRRKLLGAPLLILDKQLRFDDENILIADDKIYLTSDSKDGIPHHVNFASCWNGSSNPYNYLGKEASVLAPHFLLPPIPFVAMPATSERGAGFRLLMDFFCNDWVLHSKADTTRALGREVSVPTFVIKRGYEEDLEDAVGESDTEDNDD